MNNFFSTLGEILKYGGSTFAALVVTSIYSTTDGFFIGNFIGTNGLEAMALIFPVTLAFSALGILFEIGGSAIVSEKIGANQKNLAEKIMRTNYLVAIIFGIIIAIFGNIFVEPLLKILADTAEEKNMIELAISYLRISFCGVPFLLTITLTGAFMRCVEKPTHVFYLVGTTSLTNIILDAIFIIIFGWGMKGAAFATLISQILGTIISVWYFKFSRQKFKTSLSFASFEYILRECKIGGGFAITNLMMCFIETFLNATLMNYNATHLLAAVTLSNIILSFIYLPLDGMDTGIQPLISKLFFSKNREKSFQVMRYGFFLSLTLVFAMYLSLMIFTEELANFFSDEPVTPDMIIFLRLSFALQPFVGIQIWLSGIMSALEDEWRNLLISFSPLVVQVPLIILLPKFFEIEFIALNYSIFDFAEAVAAFILIRPFLREKGFSLKKIFTR